MTVTAGAARADNTGRAILASLADRIGPQKFNVWFRASTRVELQDGHVKLNVANPFVGSWIDNHFMSDLEAAVRTGLGRAVPVLICVDPKLTGRLRKRQLDNQATQVSRSTSGSIRANPQPAPPKLRHKLDTFVVGESNRLAYTAAVSVTGRPDRQFNPLFIHGGCGLGKTHLLQGICNAVDSRHDRRIRWRYVSGEQFTNEFVHAIKAKRLEAFRATYRKLDLLAIDDVHFLAAKRATQEEFLHTFNTIDAAGKQIVMASDAHPKLVGQLAEQLVNRFLSGMVVRVDPPDHATRVKILRRWAAELPVAIGTEILDYIAQHVRGNVRELEGALTTLGAVAGLGNQPVTVQMASDVLAEHLAQTDSALTLGDIENLVAAYFGVTPADLHSSRRTRIVSLARMFAMMLARRHTPMSFPEIGRAMGKNHSSVILAVQRLEKLLKENGVCKWMTPSGLKTAPARRLLAMFQEQLPLG